MTSDKSTNPHDEDPPSRVFDETRPSTLANSAPKTPPIDTEAEAPAPIIIKPTEPKVSFDTQTPDAESAESSPTEPQTSALTNTAPQLATARAAQVDTPDKPIDAEAPAEIATASPAVAPTPQTIAPELLEEFAALQQPATQAPPEPLQPAENPALALLFVPAPDAPFQSSVTVGIRCDAPDAQIYYTLDGTLPDQTSPAYDKDKILLTQSATLSALAFADGKSGPLQSADYIVQKPLWQENEPADPSDPTEHKASKNWSAPDGWRLAAASVRGKLHAHRALWREDAFALGNIETPQGNWNAILVSDGAGSAPLSRIGSRVACEAALQSLQSSLGQLDALSDDAQTLATDDLPRLRAALVAAAADALAALNAEAQTRNQPLSAFAATLLILVRRAWNGKQLCAAIQIGDGAIALDCQSGLKMLGEADHGQHSSETRFLTTGGIEASLASRVKFSLPDDLRATLVVSDGVSDDYFPEDKRLSEVFDAVKPLAQTADDAGAALLDWLGYEKKGSSDDRTLVLSWPSGSVAMHEFDSAKPALADGGSDGAGLTSSSNRDDGEMGVPETVLASEADATQAGLPPSSNLEVEAETRAEGGGSRASSELPPTDGIDTNETRPDVREPTDGS